VNEAEESSHALLLLRSSGSPTHASTPTIDRMLRKD
jgi:hypothetical protein